MSVKYTIVILRYCDCLFRERERENIFLQFLKEKKYTVIYTYT